MKCTNSPKYWEILKGQKDEEDIPIDNETMYKHFKDSSSTETDVNSEEYVHESSATETNLELNIPFTEIEIQKSVEKLRNNKAYRSDLLIMMLLTIKGI